MRVRRFSDSVVGLALVGGMVSALAGPVLAEGQCRQALALGLDVSGSVNPIEYDLQLHGLAEALRTDAVQRAILAFPQAPVRLYVYEWSGLFSQTEIIPWVEISSVADLERVADRLEVPEPRPRQAETAVGTALLFGAKALSLQEECWRRTIDISADGKNNIGPTPGDVAQDPMLQDVTVNALVVGVSVISSDARRTDSIPELSGYYASEVIQGPDAFVEVAVGYADYARAMEQKLLRELQTLPITEAEPLPHVPVHSELLSPVQD